MATFNTFEEAMAQAQIMAAELQTNNPSYTYTASVRSFKTATGWIYEPYVQVTVGTLVHPEDCVCDDCNPTNN